MRVSPVSSTMSYHPPSQDSSLQIVTGEPDSQEGHLMSPPGTPLLNTRRRSFEQAFESGSFATPGDLVAMLASLDAFRREVVQEIQG